MSRNRPTSPPPPEGRLALVTGATGGIGVACARALAAAGHRLALTYASRRREAEELAAELGGSAFEVDLRHRDEVKALARRVEDELGPVEILVHNAGLIRDGLLAFLSDDDWDEVMAVNLHGPYVLTKALLRGMLRRRWGRVISIASVSGQLGHRGQAHYSAAKAGLIAFTKTLALEVASYNVTANSVAPGFIDTEMLAGLGEERLARFLAGVPLGRLGTAEEVASLVAYLASEEAAFITGQTLRIDGGLLTA
jgi:3-oxoacyl-[acyl-carrier protein] reductase